MPELPEVETIRRTLSKKVQGKTIRCVEILLPRLIKWPSAPEFQAVVTHKTVKNLARRGKYLLFYLSEGQVMVVHLRMTGRLYYRTPDMARDRFTHLVFTFENGDELLYADTRTLGTLYVMPEGELWRISGLSQMGPEPLSAEFTLSYLQTILAKRKGKIKSLLLNQNLIGGLGNIYVDESLALAGIHPERAANSLTDEETKNLFQAINQVIQAGIDHGGTTFRDYRNGEGKSGDHQRHLRVYGRKNQLCAICGSKIERTEVGGRGTHYCPHCQH
ncbi:zinc finger fpg-type signature [Lucifera butyrica]|uniref:Formamidopyrimidine-DNA glycosylase n=1 Tax=Lucifera butyrica TaxID=1351585 RepID=A0A498RF74_9FIRM|nr:bifunctional DNA-formamidopyrimidine glycosylase/DNA-(apurinic or apyrimidinic site) lyase [Lucifera butyrica]VBB08752.1 zinc finger fpg-type signature [Lucifera butyrica]